MTLLRDRLALVWIGLVAATCVSTWLLGPGAIGTYVPALGLVGVVALAALKVHYVLLDFMELRHAPRGPRIAFKAWITVVSLMIIVGGLAAM